MFKYVANFITDANFDSNVQVAKRAYDNLYCLWVKGYFYDPSTPEEPSASVLAWGTIGVYDEESDAKDHLTKIRAAVKARA
jgi:hypothetical protein